MVGVAKPSSEPSIVAVIGAFHVPGRTWVGAKLSGMPVPFVVVAPALDDHEGTGVRVSDRSELERLGWEITPIPRTAFLSTPLREQPTGRQRVEIVVSCDAG